MFRIFDAFGPINVDWDGLAKAFGQFLLFIFIGTFILLFVASIIVFAIVFPKQMRKMKQRRAEAAKKKELEEQKQEEEQDKQENINQ